MNKSEKNDLHRKLESRHVQFIAFGGAIGSGLFLGTGLSVASAGPSIILGYIISGFIFFLIMRQLGEMITEEPVAGSFSHFANKYCGKISGFISGWSYWLIQIMCGITALTSVAVYTLYWFPTIVTWKSALFFFVLVNIISFSAVKIYGEIEFWFSVVKVAAVCAMISIGLYILFLKPDLIPGANIKNLWLLSSTQTNTGLITSIISGFFPHGIIGLISVIPVMIFSFDGLEYVGIAVAETADPEKTIPKAINQVVIRTTLLYVGSLFVLLSLYHWSSLSITDVPFLMIFERIGFKYAAWVFNFVILTAALSVYIGSTYSNTRTLHGLSSQGIAPKIFKKTTKTGVTVSANILSGICTFLVVPLNYFMPNWFDVFQIIVKFIVVFIIITWILISFSHIKFKEQKKIENHITKFKSPFYPYSNYFIFIFSAFILVIVFFTHF
jgi:L-asparagine transporter-like permease